MGTILGILKGALNAIATVFGWAKQRSALNNSPDEQANAEAQEIQNLRDQAAKGIASKDQSALDKDIAS